MAVARRILERATPRSAFSLTLLTFAAIFLVVGFFVQDIQLVSVDGEIDESGLLSDRALTLRAGESYRTGPIDEELNLPLDVIEDDPVERVKLEDEPATGLAMNTGRRHASRIPVPLSRQSFAGLRGFAEPHVRLQMGRERQEPERGHAV